MIFVYAELTVVSPIGTDRAIRFNVIHQDCKPVLDLIGTKRNAFLRFTPDDDGIAIHGINIPFYTNRMCGGSKKSRPRMERDVLKSCVILRILTAQSRRGYEASLGRRIVKLCEGKGNEVVYRH